MSRSLGDLKMYSRAVLSSESAPWHLDPTCLAIPWREDVIKPKGRRLRFGIVLDNDGDISVQPPIARGLALARKALEAAGHEVFEWAPTDHSEIVKLTNSAFHSLGGAAIVRVQNEHAEPVFESMKGYEAAYNKGEGGTLGPTKLREMIVARNGLQKAYLDRWSATAEGGKAMMDGIICPASPWTAPRLGLTQKVFNVSFTATFNLLDYPACTFPVAFADKNLDKPRTSSWTPLNENDAALQADYDPEFYDGTPITLQCVGHRLEDEKVLEMTGIIADALSKYA